MKDTNVAVVEKNNNVVMTMVAAALLLGIAIFLSACASGPDQSLIGSFYVLEGSEEGPALVLPAELYKVTRERDHYRVWDRELGEPVVIDFKNSTGSFYFSFAGNAEIKVTSKEETSIALAGGSVEGLFIKESVSINNNPRMIVKGVVPGFVFLQNSGKSSSIKGDAVNKLFKYWMPEASYDGIAISD